MEPSKIWLTGATGFVGSHFLYHVLENSQTEVVAVVRPSSTESARARVLRTLEAVAASYREPLHTSAFAKRLHVVEGDITMPACGVAEDALEPRLRQGVHSVWHMAASLQFESKYADEIRLHNVGGTHNALALAEQLPGATFVYVSTAYSCGRQSGLVPETLHSLEREFCNVYERTKCEAEHVVANWARSDRRAAAILRPSIVVGPRRTHLPGGSDTGLYGFTREIHRLKRMLQPSNTSLVLIGDPETPVNLIPVDDVAHDMWSIALREFDQRMVHHVVSTEQPSVATLLATVARHCEVLPIRARLERDAPASPVEQAIDRRSTFYGSYLRYPKQFARADGRSVCVSDEDLDHLVREYTRQRDKSNIGAAFKRTLIDGNQRGTLISFSSSAADGRPTLVLCNALGIAADVWVPLAKALAPSFRILTWELRSPARLLDAPLTPRDHAQDLARVLDHHDVHRAYVAGWCSGADIAALFAAERPDRVLGLISIHGALNGASPERTTFQESLAKLVGQVASDLRRAGVYHGLLFGQRRGYGSVILSSGERDEAMLSAMIRSLDPSLLHLTSAPFRDPAALYGYARAMREYYKSCARGALPDVRVPTLVITGDQDDVVHAETSRAAARRWPYAQLLDLPQGDHFSLYHDSRVPSAVATFVQQVEQGRLPTELPIARAA